MVRARDGRPNHHDNRMRLLEQTHTLLLSVLPFHVHLTPVAPPGMCHFPPGTVLRNDVVGRIQMKCFLSDMPELRLGLNDQMQVGTVGVRRLRQTKCG